MTKNADRNIFGEPLRECSCSPMTGFYRDGKCSTGQDDQGVHTVCTEVTRDFLVFSAKCGNDLSTPRPEFGFEGLKAGDKWCLCAARWLEAFEAGKAPMVYLESTHERTLDIVPLEFLQRGAVKAKVISLFGQERESHGSQEP